MRETLLGNVTFTKSRKIKDAFPVMTRISTENNGSCISDPDRNSDCAQSCGTGGSCAASCGCECAG